MVDKKYLGWVRDTKGNIIYRPVKEIANAVTTFCANSHTDKVDGLGNTTPHIIYCFT